MKAPKLPKVSLILMIAFTVIGSIMMAIPNLPKNVFGLDIVAFILSYLGYVFVIGACVYYAKTGH